jgi:hypothetical protein
MYPAPKAAINRAFQASQTELIPEGLKQEKAFGPHLRR